MRQVTRSLAEFVFIFAFLSILLGCESDQEFNVDDKTTDITLENAELIALGVIQSGILSILNSPISDFLDGSDMPNGATKGEAYDCALGGIAKYDYSRSAGANHKNGDMVSVEYSDCTDEKGLIHNGKMEATYTKIKGLNDRFIEIDTFECVASLLEDLGLDDRSNIASNDELKDLYSTLANSRGELRSELYDRYQVYPTNSDISSEQMALYPIEDEVDFDVSVGDVDVVFFIGNDVRFEPSADMIIVQSRFFEESFDPETGNTVGKVVIREGLPNLDLDDTVIYVNLLSNIPGNSGNITSMDGGDQVFSITEGDIEQVNCQKYERRLDAKLTNFSTEKDGLTTVFDGDVELFQFTENLRELDSGIKLSDYTTTVMQHKDEDKFEMSDFTAIKKLDVEGGSYSLDVQGLIKSDALFGQVLAGFGPIKGHESRPNPDEGRYPIAGQGVELVGLAFEGENNIEITVDYDGDNSGNGFSDPDATIDTTWEDLLAREFKEVEYD